jgi:hypothetical protein
MLVTCVTLACWATAAQALPVLIAQTGFEASEGYVAGNNVRSQPPTGADGAGWGTNNWAGEGTTSSGNSGSTLFMPVISDASKARSGDQYFVIHADIKPSTGENRIRRKFDTSLVQNNRLAFGASVRLDTDPAAYAANGKWFASHFYMYLELGTSDPNPNEGKQNVRLEFTRDTGKVNVKYDGSSHEVGSWTDPASAAYAKDTWLDVLFDADTAAQTFDLYLNGSKVGNYPFYASLGSGDLINQIRFQGPRNYTGYLNSGASIDNVSLTTTPEPAAVASAVLGGLLVLRRRIRA